MLIDTGAVTSLITPETAQSLKISDDFSAAPLNGINGRVMAPAAVSQDLAFGRVDVGNETFLIAKIVAQVPAGEQPIDGLIGNDILQNFDIALDFPDKELSLLLPGSCAQVLPPWIGNYANFPLRTADNGSPRLPMQIDGVDMNAILDSGAAATTVSVATLERDGIIAEGNAPQIHIHTTGVGALPGTASLQRFTTITIGPESFQNRRIPVTRSAAFADSDIDAIIGEDYLRGHRVLIAHHAQTIYLGFRVPKIPK